MLLEHTENRLTAPSHGTGFTMNEQDAHAEQPSPASKRDKWIKIGFVAALVLAVMLVWLVQRKPPELAGWGHNLRNALREGRDQNRNVLILFSDSGETSRWLVKHTLSMPENSRAIEAGRFVRVQVTTTPKSDLASRYKLRTLPTMLIIGPAGQELNRREGKIGEVAFRKGFLDLANVEEALTEPGRQP